MKILSLIIILLIPSPSSFAQENVRILQRETVLNLEWGSEPGEVGFRQDGSYNFGPDSFLVDENDTVYVSDPVNSRMAVFAGTGEFVRNFPLIGFGETCWGDDGSIYLNHYTKHTVLKYTKAGNLIGKYAYDLNERDTLQSSDLIVKNGAFYISIYKYIPQTSFTVDSEGIKTYMTERTEVSKRDNPQNIGKYSNSMYIKEDDSYYMENDEKQQLFNENELPPDSMVSFLAEDRDGNKFFIINSKDRSRQRTSVIWNAVMYFDKHFT